MWMWPASWLSCDLIFWKLHSDIIGTIEMSSRVFFNAIYFFSILEFLCNLSWIIDTWINMPDRQQRGYMVKHKDTFWNRASLSNTLSLNLSLTALCLVISVILYNWLIWRVLKLAFFFKKIISLYLFWRLQQSAALKDTKSVFLCDL